MSKSDTFENDLLNLIFKGVAIANIADNASVSPLTSLYASLHTSDPGEAGTQTTNEANYTGYGRKAVARGAGFTVTGNTVTLAANITFDPCTAGTNTITHFAIGVASSGSSKILYSGTVSPNISVANGVTPIITTAGTSITED